MAATIYDRLLLAKLEVTKGTDSVPAPATDAVRCRSFKVTPNTNAIDRNNVKQTMGNLAHLIGKQFIQLEVVLELRGSGAAGTAPEYSPLLQACRVTETIVPATSVSYNPSSAAASEKSASIYVYEDGLLWKLLGAVGDCKMEATIDGIIIATLTMSASYLAPTVVAVPAGAVFDSSQPLVMNYADVINDGAAIKVGKFGLDFGNDVQEHYTTGQHEFIVANRNPSCTFSKDSISTATEWTDLTAATNVALSAAFGSVAGNICTITAPVARRKNVAISERAERHLRELTYGLYESTSDDQFTIAFT